MKVILLENVAPIGSLGDVINVRAGYARNYLFPQGKAERASDEAMKDFEKRRAELQKRQDEMTSVMESAYQTLNGYTLQFTARSSPDGNLYGSITPQMVATALNEQKLIGDLVIKRGQVNFPNGQIKELGEHEATVRLTASTVADFTVSVLAETAAAAASSATLSSTQEKENADSSQKGSK